ncbi:YihY/virulence factor BrkB family protein, partial [Actinomadura sp. HBU206391]|uniref:YihY/virulence factor BrkB family protein n=1 Tax=Actinomadura sp. HBU206391 TaxID=2731692 RepID=UPI001C9C0776
MTRDADRERESGRPASVPPERHEERQDERRGERQPESVEEERRPLREEQKRLAGRLTAHGPRRLGELPLRGWWGAVRRIPAEFADDGLADWAAALTYYAVLSIFPALLCVVSLVGLAGRSVTESLMANLGTLAPGPVKQILTGALTELQRGRGGAGLVALAGLAVAFWSASKYVAAFIRASNAVYDIDEGRPIWKTLPLRLSITLVSLVLLAVTAMAVVLSGDLAHRVGEMIGVGSAAVTVWNLAKWPVLLVMVGLLFALLYWAAPNAKQRFQWVTPGGILALVIWITASTGFAIYVAAFGSYNKTYGSIATVVVFLVWLWVTNLALLIGAELNAELE